MPKHGLRGVDPQGRNVVFLREGTMPDGTPVPRAGWYLYEVPVDSKAAAAKDDAGNLISVPTLSVTAENGKPPYWPEDEPYPILKYDSYGGLVKTNALDAEGNPILGDDGLPIQVTVPDTRAHLAVQREAGRLGLLTPEEAEAKLVPVPDKRHPDGIARGKDGAQLWRYEGYSSVIKLFAPETDVPAGLTVLEHPVTGEPVLDEHDNPWFRDENGKPFRPRTGPQKVDVPDGLTAVIDPATGEQALDANGDRLFEDEEDNYVTLGSLTPAEPVDHTTLEPQIDPATGLPAIGPNGERLMVDAQGRKTTLAGEPEPFDPTLIPQIDPATGLQAVDETGRRLFVNSKLVNVWLDPQGEPEGPFQFQPFEDPATGERFFLDPDGDVVSIGRVEPAALPKTLEELVVQNIINGNIDAALAIEDFRRQPTKLELLTSAMDIANSPIDFVTLSSIRRGIFEGGPEDIPRSIDSVMAIFESLGLSPQAQQEKLLEFQPIRAAEAEAVTQGRVQAVADQEQAVVTQEQARATQEGLTPEEREGPAADGAPSPPDVGGAQLWGEAARQLERAKRISPGGIVEVIYPGDTERFNQWLPLPGETGAEGAARFRAEGLALQPGGGGAQLSGPGGGSQLWETGEMPDRFQPVPERPAWSRPLRQPDALAQAQNEEFARAKEENATPEFLRMLAEAFAMEHRYGPGTTLGTKSVNNVAWEDLSPESQALGGGVPAAVPAAAPPANVTVGSPQPLLPKLGFTIPSMQGLANLSPIERELAIGEMRVAGITPEEFKFDLALTTPRSPANDRRTPISHYSGSRRSGFVV
jgi:hypothetical protein